MWSIYDELIAAIPPDLTVNRCLIGLRWTMVQSIALGMAMTPPESDSPGKLAGRIAGMPLSELAGYVKSWDNMEAALGLAAINSFFNSPEYVEHLFGFPLGEQISESAFGCLRDVVWGKKVGVVGHFPGVEKDLAEICELSILERLPQPGDYPDPACEYILPQQDFVFITATSLVNKTLPRLLALSRQATVILVGPSAPLTPILFRHGIDMVSGTVVVQSKQVWQIVQEGGKRDLFRKGAQRVNVRCQTPDTAGKISTAVQVDW